MIRNTNTQFDFSVLEDILKVKTTHGSRYSTLKLDNAIGKGLVKILELSNGIKTIDFDLTLSESLEIPISYTKLNTTQLLYVYKGDCSYTSHTEWTPIQKFQTAITINKIELNPRLKFKKNSRVVVNIIELKKNVYTKLLTREDCNFSLDMLRYIKKINKSEKTIYLGQSDLRLAEYFKKYYAQKEPNEHDSLLSLEGRLALILSNHFQLALHYTDTDTNCNSLSYNDLIKVSNLSEKIKLNPEVPYSIDFLSSTSALSPAKLQEGFKSLFNRTVSDFIRRERLLKAEKLMSTTDLNISEIVYSIGFTSRSYFCKIFKREFNCSPKQYKKKIKRIALIPQS